MPHTRSAKKRLRQNIKRRDKNRDDKKMIKYQIKLFTKAVESGNIEEARNQLNLCAKRLDKAAARHVIHRNKAARKKSQLARQLNAKASPATPPAGDGQGE